MKDLIIEAFEPFCSVSSIEHVESRYYDLYQLSFKDAVRWERLKSCCEAIEAIISSSCRVLIPIPGTVKVGVEIPKPFVPSLPSTPTIDGSVVFAGNHITSMLIGETPFKELFSIDLGYEEDVVLIGQDAEEMAMVEERFLDNIAIFCKAKKIPFEKRYLSTSLVNDEKVLSSLDEIIDEIQNRRKRLYSAKVRNIDEYNALYKPMPRIAVVLDKFNDLSDESQRVCLDKIEEITLKNSSLGIFMFVHFVAIGSNRELEFREIKNIFENKIFLRMSADKSMYFLDCNDAEYLQGNGDILYNNGTYSYRVHV